MSHDHSDDKKPVHKHSGPSCCFSRRGILGMGALGVAGAMLPSPLVKSAAADRDDDDDDDDRRNRGRRGRLLLKGGTVLTMMDGQAGLPKPDTDVRIVNGKIWEVGKNLRDGDGEVIDCRGKIVMPGFVDTHRHMWQGLLRNVGPDDLLLDYLISVLGLNNTKGFALNLTPDEVYIGDLISAYSAMNSGITTILDWSHINTTPAHSDAVIKALQDSGIRAVYGYGPNFFHDMIPAPRPPNPYPGDLERIAKRYFSSKDQLLTLAVAAAGPQFVPLDFAVVEWQTARKFGARISVHVGVGNSPPPTDLGGDGVLEALVKKGVPLLSDTTYIHACTLKPIEFKMISDSGGSTSLAFPVEMQMGHGTPPIQQCLDPQNPIQVSLSVDVETNQSTDMFNQMHFCFALQRAIENEDHLHPDTSHREKLLTVREVLEFATVGGARANGLTTGPTKVGTLERGNEADILLLNARAINVAPVNDPIGAVVLGMDSSNVDSVFIAGRAVKRNGRLLGVDVDRLLAKAERAREALRARVGH